MTMTTMSTKVYLTHRRRYLNLRGNAPDTSMPSSRQTATTRMTTKMAMMTTTIEQGLKMTTTIEQGLKTVCKIFYLSDTSFCSAWRQRWCWCRTDASASAVTGANRCASVATAPTGSLTLFVLKLAFYLLGMFCLITGGAVGVDSPTCWCGILKLVLQIF